MGFNKEEDWFRALLRGRERERESLNNLMAPSFDSCRVGCYNDDDDESIGVGVGFGVGVDLHPQAAAGYPHRFIPMAEGNCNGNGHASSFIFPHANETRDCKRLKRNGGGNIFTGGGSNLSHSAGNGSLVNVNILPKLHFRDHIRIFTQRYLAAEAATAAVMVNSDDGGGGKDGCADGMKLVQLLIACAEAVACRDKSHASVLLSDLRANALVFGSSFQRVASCFVQGLADRLSTIQPLGAAGVVSPTMNIMDGASEKMEEALHLVYEICPYIKFGHFVANSTILEAFEGKNLVHVVDLGMTLSLSHGYQWRGLIHSLANRSGNPPRRLRITGVGLRVDTLHTIGDELTSYAKQFDISFDFSVVNRSLDTLTASDIKIDDDEVVVVNSIFQLHCVVKESRGALNSVLQMLHGLCPKLFVLVEQDSSHNGPFFLGRFMEALHYYSAIFDSLDTMLPKYDTRRAKMEQFYFAEEIKNIVSCEGPARVERHERVDQWRRRMSRAGFQAAPVKMMSQSKQWLSQNKICDGYTIVEEKGCLVLGWKSRPIVAASCWK